MDNNTPTFAKQDNLKFFRTLNSRVNNYFKEKNIQKTGNWKLYLKTFILFSVFLAPYFIIITLPNIHFGLFFILFFHSIVLFFLHIIFITLFHFENDVVMFTYMAPVCN